jgi:holliday junction DNA helicase RuvA
MIARLQGTLVEVDQPHIVLDVAGVGYELEVPVTTLAALPGLNQTVTLHVHQGQRDEVPVLFGFLSRVDRTLFQAITKISGVGPKMGLAILSTYNLEELSSFAQAGDIAALTAIPGVGKRTAERLAVELKSRLPDAPMVSTGQKGSANDAMEARAALVALGYAEKDARAAIDLASKDGATNTEALIRGGLKHLSKVG